MHSEKSSEMGTTTRDIRNFMVNKEKFSDFLSEIIANPILVGCEVKRVLPSGNYYIFTFYIDNIEQKDLLKSIEPEWI